MGTMILHWGIGSNERYKLCQNSTLPGIGKSTRLALDSASALC
jgi:hypothetical protein